MTCQQVQTQIESYIDGMLRDAEVKSVADHLAHCSICKEFYNQQKYFLFSLSQVPIQKPPSGYKKRAFAYAKKTHEGYHRGFNHGILVTAVSAMVLMLVMTWMIILDNPIQKTPSKQFAQLEQLKMSMDETRVVQLIFDSPVDIDQAKMALKLLADITLVDVPELDIPGSRKVSWMIDIKQGRNRLSLLNKARGKQGGQVIAELRHNDDKKTFTINIEIDPQKIIFQDQGNIQSFI